jgi:hypothetical protein
MLANIVDMAKVALGYMKARNSRNYNNPENKDKVATNKEGGSIIYWLINFTPKNKHTMTSNLNPHSILELVIRMLPKCNNLHIV